jgi:rhodanese-related sulfurtransferase
MKAMKRTLTMTNLVLNLAIAVALIPVWVGAEPAQTAPVISGLELAREARKEVREMDVADARKWMTESDTLILDVREADEYAQGYIPGAVNIPRGMLEFRVGAIPQMRSTDAKVLVYCRSGQRGALAAQTLKRMGYTNVVSLKPGIEAWTASGWPVEHPKTEMAGKPPCDKPDGKC